MQNYVGFESTELSRLGIVCKECGTEVIFDLSKPRSQDAQTYCPACGDKEFFQTFNPFGNKMFDPATVYQKLTRLEGKNAIRLYFKASE
jgi:hypothetical protein